jgi:hypothetical protein
MSQEAVAHSRALVSAFDKAGDVRYDETDSGRSDYPEPGDFCRERVIGDFRPRVAHFGDKRGFSAVGESHKTDVRNELELEPQPSFYAGFPFLESAGRAIS